MTIQSVKSTPSGGGVNYVLTDLSGAVQPLQVGVIASPSGGSSNTFAPNQVGAVLTIGAPGQAGTNLQLSQSMASQLISILTIFANTGVLS
jgi:hypothetical protein